MIFLADIAFAIELISLVLGYWILNKVYSKEANYLGYIGKFIGYFVIIGSFLAILCTGYYAVVYWIGGSFDNPQSVIELTK